MKKLVFVLIFINVLFAKIGFISYIEGNATIIRNDINITAQKNSLLEVNDTVVTYKNSFVKMEFNDHTIISLGANSKFKIEEYIFNNKKPSLKFKFFSGVFRSITGKIGKIAPKRFKLQTKNVSIGIRGTIVLGKILNSNNLIVCESGIIDVVNLNTKKSVILKAGEGIMVAKNFMSNIIKMPFNLIKTVYNSIFSPLEKEQKEESIKKQKTKIKNNVVTYNKTKVINKKIKETNNTEINWSKYIIEPLNKKIRNNKKNSNIFFDNEIYDLKMLLKGN